MNKKGTTIIELIISLALISVILLFMMKLLIDINNSSNNDTFAKDNQFNRVEIIRTIENDLKSKTLSDISVVNTSNSITINYLFNNGKRSTITLRNDSLTYYIQSSNTTKRWEMKDCTIYLKDIAFSIIKDTRNYSFVMNIQVNTINDYNNDINNNYIDDITINYFGNSSDLVSDLNLCLGTRCL